VIRVMAASGPRARARARWGLGGPGGWVVGVGREADGLRERERVAGLHGPRREALAAELLGHHVLVHVEQRIDPIVRGAPRERDHGVDVRCIIDPARGLYARPHDPEADHRHASAGEKLEVLVDEGRAVVVAVGGRPPWRTLHHRVHPMEDPLASIRVHKPARATALRIGSKADRRKTFSRGPLRIHTPPLVATLAVLLVISRKRDSPYGMRHDNSAQEYQTQARGPDSPAPARTPGTKPQHLVEEYVAARTMPQTLRRPARQLLCGLAQLEAAPAMMPLARGTGPRPGSRWQEDRRPTKWERYKTWFRSVWFAR